MKPYIYFAGPDLFLKKENKNVSEYIKSLSDTYDFHYYYPGDFNEEELSSKEIFTLNKMNLTTADLCVANLIDWRGPEMDVGTAWEIGYAAALGIPVFGYQPVNVPLKTKHPETSTFNTEDFGYSQNLMIIESLVCYPFSDIFKATDAALQYFNKKGL